MTPHSFLVFLATASVAAAGPLTRVANDTLKLPAELPGGSFKTENAFPGISFQRPVGIVTPPGETNRLFVLEQRGLIRVIPDLENPSKETFLDLSRATALEGESGFLGLAFHPQYASNRLFYVFYTITIDRQRIQRVARFETDPNNPNRALADSEVPMIDQRDEASNHNGGDLQFGPDGYLYISLGDEGGANDRFNNGAFIDRDFFAAIARIDVDQLPGSLKPNAHPGVHPDTYTIPPDNPFIGQDQFMGERIDPDEVRTEFWAVGLRNPWRMSFDPATGRLFTGDVGQGAREEINIIERGGHYGWSFREGTRKFTSGPGRSNEPEAFSPIEPIWDYGRRDGISITGGVVYRGEAHTELFESYIFGDYGSGKIWSLHFNDDDTVEVKQIGTDSQMSAFGTDPRNGDVLFTSYNGGQVKRIARKSSGFALLIPSKLSRTGAFADLETLTPNEGIVAYEPNVSFWSDGAAKKRWFSVPDLEDTITYDPQEPWTFPVGTTWIKHFELGGRHVETRFLVKTETGSYGLSYAWSDDQTDATLVKSEGHDVEVGDQTWTFPSRNACRACHTREAGHALSFNTAQLNRAHAYPDETANQLAALSEAGYFQEALAQAPETLPALAAMDDRSRSLEDRARAYLATNCAQCHRQEGPALGFWDARPELSLADTALIDGELVNNLNDPAFKVVVPGDPTHSMILTRMQGEGGLPRMPRIGSNLPDTQGLALLREWIVSLGNPEPITYVDWISGANPPFLTLPNDTEGPIEIERSHDAVQWAPWTPDPESIVPQPDGRRRIALEKQDQSKQFYRFRRPQ